MSVAQQDLSKLGNSVSKEIVIEISFRRCVEFQFE